MKSTVHNSAFQRHKSKKLYRTARQKRRPAGAQQHTGWSKIVSPYYIALKPANEIRSFVNLGIVKRTTTALSVGIKYSMRDPISDVNHCSL